MNRLSLPLLLTVLLSGAAPSAMAATPAPACLPTVNDAWIRMPPANLPMMAGYARIVNRCDAAVAIVSADSAAFVDTSLHQTRVEAGISRMRATPSLAIPAGGSVTLAPGGFHLMLMQPQVALRAGQHVTINFVLQDGRKFAAAFEVRAVR
ncbi:MAG: copper chaperone PCu(A)C [Luteimonas sp.]